MAKIPSSRSAKVSKVQYEATKPGLYPARLVRFTGLGTQPQPEFQGQAKDPAPKVAVMFELYDPQTAKPLDVIGVNIETEEKVARPSCVFQDYFLFPGATRGKVFELTQALDASMEKVPDDFEWFLSRLGAPVQVQVGNYKKKDGSVGVKVVSVTGVNSFVSNAMEPARSELVGFDPYDDNVEKFERAYAQMFPFQRTMLKDALDAKHIPLAGTEPVKIDDNPANTENRQTSKPETTVTQTGSAPSEPTGNWEDDDDRPF
ncbi:hypothetical protein [Escherichia phage PJNS034]